jgi:hypothetical protein
MYEITHKGAWFQWSALTAEEKRLAGLSIVTSAVPGLLAGFWLGEYAFQLGFRLGSGGKAADTTLWDTISASPWFGAFVLFAAACAVVSGIAWWRFSRRQDEMFNRVQNYAIGQAGAWSLAAASLWWMLSLGGFVGPLPLGWFIHFSLLLVVLFWFQAVRRWA